MMVSLQYTLLQTCCRSRPHFMAVLKIVHRLPASHDKVIYMNFSLMSTNLTSLKISVHGRTGYIKYAPFLCCVSMAVMGHHRASFYMASGRTEVRILRDEVRMKSGHSEDSFRFFHIIGHHIV